MREYKSFIKTVGGNEGTKCRYPTRLDTYGCGCSHNCRYCYARSLLEFRGLWRPGDPAVADIGKISRKLDGIQPGSVLRLGGMTDCFQPAEKRHRITLRVIEELNRRGISYLIVTKSALVADDDYLKIYDPVLRWMMDNIYIRTDPAGNIKPDKEKSTEKIDGAVATVMALDRAIRCGNDTSESVYDSRGLLFV